jgi:hypothetical protein
MYHCLLSFPLFIVKFIFFYDGEKYKVEFYTIYQRIT